jgi:hypothetical protein
MKKAENEKDYLIGYGIAVLLIAAFFCISLTGTDGIAQPLVNIITLCEDHQDYECTHTAYQYGEVYDLGPTCMELCYDDGFEVEAYGVWFSCYLYPTNSKNLLGTADTNYEWAGCSVERRGRSLTASITYIQEGEGYVDIFRCKACNNCCSSFTLNINPY